METVTERTVMKLVKQMEKEAKDLRKKSVKESLQVAGRRMKQKEGEPMKEEIQQTAVAVMKQSRPPHSGVTVRKQQEKMTVICWLLHRFRNRCCDHRHCHWQRRGRRSPAVRVCKVKQEVKRPRVLVRL